MLIHIADAPAHGKEFHEGKVGDDRPEEQFFAFDPLMSKLKSLNIAYWFGYINRDRTDTMVERLDRLLQTCRTDTAHPYTTGISQFNAVDPTKLFQALEETVSQSIRTMERSSRGKNECQIPYTINEETPRFTSEDSEVIQQSNVLAFSKPDTSIPIKVEAVIEKINTDWLKPSKPKTIQKAKQPFSAGAQCVAYHAQDKSSGERYVIKESKYQMSTEDKDSDYMTVVTVCGLCTMYANYFNEEKPSYVPEIRFTEVKYFQHHKVLNGHTEHVPYILEPYMEGSYQKYNTNGGWVTPNTNLCSCTLQAFSHYSWAKSNKELVICDLQGVFKGDQICLTDPAVHCIDYMLLQPKLGGSNLGFPGIQKFFASHNCNDICRKMRLPLFP